MPYGNMRTPVRIECLERDHGINLGDLFGNASRHYPVNISRGVVLPQHEQQQNGESQQQARAPILTTLNRYKAYLPSDVGELVEKFMQCRPGTGFGMRPEDPKQVEYVAACEAFTQSLEDIGVTHLRVI